MSSSARVDIVMALFERYYERVYAFARRTLDSSSAEDIAQEVYIRLLNQPELQTRTIKSSYLIKIADNLIKRRYRRAQQFDGYIAERARTTDLSSSRPAGVGADDVIARLGALGPREEEAIRLIVCGGLTYQQAADALGVKVSEINNWRFRAVRRLREHAAADFQGSAVGVEFGRGAELAVADRAASGQGQSEVRAARGDRVAG